MPIQSLDAIRNKKIGFSPIRVNANLFTPEKVLTLYRFAKTIFPQMGQAISVLAFTDLSKEIKRWSDSITERERKELAQSLNGISIKINISVDEKGKGEIISIPICIKTDYIIENLVKARPSVTKLSVETRELKEILLPLMKSAIKQRIKELAEDFLTLEVLKPEQRVEIKQMLEEGLITEEGKIANGVDIDQLFSKEYTVIFEKIDMEELAKHGLIKKT